MQRMRAAVVSLALISLGIALFASAPLADAPLTGSAALVPLTDQRAAFRTAHEAAERGDWQPAADAADVLEAYVLWPDLKATYLRTRVERAEADVRQFLERYGDLKPARELRYRYALHLARSARDTEFLAIYDRYYADLNEANLDCFAAEARLRSGQAQAGLELGSRLWLVGSNQVDECDPVFERMRERGVLTQTLYGERFALAIEARDFGLARYLARSLDPAALQKANRWRRAQADPQSFLARADISNRDPEYAEQLAYAARRLGYNEPVEALRHWQRLGRDLEFPDVLDDDVRRYTALWAARRHLPEAHDLLAGVREAAVDTEVRRWRIRTALRERRWQDVVAGIEVLNDREQEREEWRYWLGIARERLGERAEASTVLRLLAEERSYYGFLAADHLGLDYAFRSNALTDDRAVQRRLGSRDDIVRARELFHVGLDGRARSEWEAAMRELSDEEKTQAALLAHSWQWHSRAIATAAQSGEYDDLDVRYPLPHRDAFRSSAGAAGVRESWAYGIARSESLFMRDVRSSAGAIGVMQLMPGTGRDTAREINAPFRGQDTLTNPESNILLGTRYLAKMQQTFASHPVLATAAYNAGPRRVSAWLSDEAADDPRVWIETIPFNETRRYVRRVLAADVIFHWRLTGKTRRLSEQLPPISI